MTPNQALVYWKVQWKVPEGDNEVRANEDKPYSWSPDDILINFGVLLSAVSRYSAEFRKLYFLQVNMFTTEIPKIYKQFVKTFVGLQSDYDSTCRHYNGMLVLWVKCSWSLDWLYAV